MYGLAEHNSILKLHSSVINSFREIFDNILLWTDRYNDKHTDTQG